MAGRLRITSGEEDGRIVEIADELVIGRNRDDEGRIPDPEISRTHARVYVDADGGLTIEDLGSTNGTFVGGMRITEPRWLSPGDVLRMGQTTLEVEATHEAPPAAPPEEEEPEAREPEPEPAEPEPEPEPAEPEPEPEPAEPEPPAEPPLDDPRSKPLPVVAESTTGPEEEPLEEETPPVPPATPAGAARARGAVPRPLVAVLVGVFVLAALGIGAVVLFTGGDDEDEEAPQKTPASASVQGPPALVGAATAAGCTAQNPPIEGRQHVKGDVRYRSNPPTSGPHYERAASDGAWEVSPPVPALVHSLEHGRIVMWHRKGDQEAIKALREVGNENSSKMILTPNTTGMPYRIAASAWGHLLGCNELSDESLDAVRAFRDAYRGKGPEAVP